MKSILVAPLRILLRITAKLRERTTRLYYHSHLAAQLRHPLPSSTVVTGSATVHGTGDVEFGSECLLYPGIYLETQGAANLTLGDGIVLSRGVHLVAMAGITIGDGSMVGEYASIRDANHTRQPGVRLRVGAHIARKIILGKDVWVGRGVTILGGVTIGDGAIIGANAVVTRDVAAGAIVGGVPAQPLRKREE